MSASNPKLWSADAVDKWKSIDDVWAVDEVSFEGAFDRIRREQTSPAYVELYLPLVHKALVFPPGEGPNPRLLKSESTPTENDSAAQADIYGGYEPGAAHSVPHSPVCSPLYGIDTQAFVGYDIESHIGNKPSDRVLLVKTLQQLVCGRVGEDRRGTGFRYAPTNLLWLPPGHKKIYDDDALLIVVPILTLDEVKNWDPLNPSYWVMVLAGDHPLQSNPNMTTRNLYQNKVIMGNSAKQGEREKCTRGDIRKATKLLGQFVQAHADVLMGRGGGGKLVPEDLFAPGADPEGVRDRKAMMQATKTALTTAGGKVKVPVPVYGAESAADDGMFEYVFKSRITPAMKTDPAPLASKAAINWGHRCGQRPLPACPCPVDPDAEAEAELYALAREEHYAALDSYRPATPKEVMVGATGSARRVTMSPPFGTDGDDVSDLDEDDDEKV